MDRPKFDDNVSLLGAIKLIKPDNCSLYTFPGGVITFLIFAIIAISIFSSVSEFMDGNIYEGIYILIISFIGSLFTIYTNAYLKKGCEASKILKKLQS